MKLKELIKITKEFKLIESTDSINWLFEDYPEIKDKLPLDPQVISTCEEFKLDSTTIALSGGEDYELLFTVSLGDFPKIKANPNLSIIGHITNKKEGVHLITRGNEKIPLIARGWNSLDSNQE